MTDSSEDDDDHGIPRNVVCPECNKKFRWKSELKKHSVVHTGEKKFECGMCGKKLAYKHNLDNHLKKHMELQCKVCEKFLPSKQALMTHAAIHTKKLICNICSSGYNSQGGCGCTDWIKPQDHPCPACGKKFQQIWQVKLHWRTVHNSEHNFKFLQTCGTTCTPVHQLQQTGASLHPKEKTIFVATPRIQTNTFRNVERNLLPSQLAHCIPSLVANGCTFNCEICGELFLQRRYLDAHIQEHKDLRNFPCLKCERKFESWNLLNQHRQLCNFGNTMAEQSSRLFPDKEVLDTHVLEGVNTFQFKTSVDAFKPKLGDLMNKQASSCSKIVNVKQELPEILTPTSSSKDEAHNHDASSSSSPQSSVATKCVICGDEPGFKSSLANRFRPKGMRYVCPKCDVYLESVNNLDEYFRQASLIMHNW